MLESKESSGSLRPKARLVHTLGSELISSEDVALVELVKNAYDADATQVTIRFNGPLKSGTGSIEVWDNGHGMTADTVRKVWLDIATPYRKEVITSESGNRRVLGEKGIGRLAASRIAEHSVITTRRTDGTETTFRIDWGQFHRDLYLDEIEVAVVEEQPKVFVSHGEASVVQGESLTESGTVVKMERLLRDWQYTDIANLRLMLERMIPPLPEGVIDSDLQAVFSVELIVPDEISELGGSVSPSDILMLPDYKMAGNVSSDGIAHLTYIERRTGAVEEITINLRVSDDLGDATRLPSCGPLTIDFRAWDLDREAFEAIKPELSQSNIGIRDYRNQIKDHAGLALFRDGFRVQPFGERGYDWLNLDLRRVNSPSLRLSNNQVSGFIFLTADLNPGLRDRSHREGLIDTPEYEDLKQVSLQILAEMESRRYKFRKRLGSGRERRSPGSGLFEKFDLSGLEALAASRKADKELVAAITETAKEVRAATSDLQEILLQFAKSATLSTLVDMVLHEGRTGLMDVDNGVRKLNIVRQRLDTFDLPEVERRIGDSLDSLGNGRALVGSLFDRLSPLAGRKRGRPQKVQLSSLTNPVSQIFAAELARQYTTLSVEVDDATVSVEPIEFQHILINLVSNAMYWVRQRPDSKRKISIRAGRDDGGSIVIYVNDSGPGVPEDKKDLIFDAYVSTREGGMGLGLSIVHTIAVEYYGGAVSVDDDGALPGANFRVVLKKRVS
ncbi:putative two-component histidine kinase [Arthrobacter globiformis NBRC 12137]|uniref:histidine kinase n=1 Tax=Arthrobacter globiformis (strain ATCC 8010 / DSM 20124 / JCM 1332 / NBRC 12137 / NCIMB 8907 / NRRL B-2979 / 168) TaxID=1077972 RepID=H0QTQ5_ARTG1|nr:ATP-binding protein [Arthrobacter globiformis]GAB16206.1 putative two-component histidine kinase [Arthrobacter globiformis NBRC 12137]